MSQNEKKVFVSVYKKGIYVKNYLIKLLSNINYSFRKINSNTIRLIVLNYIVTFSLSFSCKYNKANKF